MLDHGEAGDGKERLRYLEGQWSKPCACVVMSKKEGQGGKSDCFVGSNGAPLQRTP